ncbi:MAG: glycosyltransferase family 2 protein [Bacteroidota bacterium]
MSDVRIAIVILNWNGKHFLERFLPSVMQHSTGAAVYVADNASTDDSIAFLTEKYSSVKQILLDKNYGFAGGYNKALAQVDADYFVLLNSDIEVTDGWINPVIQLMEKDKTIGACQPKLLSCTERDTFEYAGAAGGFIDRYGYPFCKGRIFQSLEKDQNQFDSTYEVFWATGACLFVRASLYKELGGLDDDFFAHMEEIDFCWRLKIKGYKIMYCPESTVYHVGGGTLHKSNPRKTFLNFRNNFYLLYKNLPGKRLFPVFAARLFLDGIAGFKFLLDGGFRDCFAVVKAHFAFYGAIGKLRKKRRQINPHPVSRIYKRNLVFEYFLRKKKKFSELDTEKFS